MYLLDTCVLLWLVGDQNRLTSSAREQLAGAAGSIFVSAISAFEIGIKHRKGSLTLPLEPAAWIEAAIDLHGLLEMPVDRRVAALSTELPPIHSDPCDRILVATARLHNLVIVTPDRVIPTYPDVRVAW